MDVSLTLWVLTIVGLAALIAVDFFIGRKPHDVSIKEAGIWTVVWIALALGILWFAMRMYVAGRDKSYQPDLPFEDTPGSV